MARRYTKRSEYWEQFNKNKIPLEKLIQPQEEGFQPELIGEPVFSSESSRLDSPTARTKARTNAVATSGLGQKFQNIKNGILPFNYEKDSADAREAVELCQKAYFNISSFKGTIDLLSEFADSEIYLEGGTEKSKKFIEAWFKRIKIHNLKQEIV